MNDKINFEVLNSFIDLLIMDVAAKYLFQAKKEKKFPPKLIENYLEQALFLLKKYKTINIEEIKDTIENLSKEEQKEFNKLFESDQEYESLCKQLNFAYLLMIDEKLQKKTLALIYDNFYEYKTLINQDLVIKKQVSISKVIEQSNTKKINKLHQYKNYNSYVQA